MVRRQLRLNTYLLSVFVAIGMTVYSQHLDQHAQKALENQYSFIPGGVETLGVASENVIIREKDSTLLFYPKERQAKVGDMYMMNHEVTNEQYRRFVEWVRDSVVRRILSKYDPEFLVEGTKRLNYKKHYNLTQVRKSEKFKDALDEIFLPKREGEDLRWVRTDILLYEYTHDGVTKTLNIFPDTSEWRNIKGFSGPLADHYYSHESYDNYPMVNVTHDQAEAFCEWVTYQFERDYGRFLNGKKVVFRLPTEDEWEYAAHKAPSDGKEADRRYYAWNGNSMTGKDGKYRANYGVTLDRNNVLIKHFMDDGGFFSVPIKSYQPNGYGLYDMCGNVAEWTDTPASLDHVEVDNSGDQGKLVEHDQKVIKSMKEPYVVKGGSWMDGAVYLQLGRHEAHEKASASPRVGFRMCVKVE